jgi:anti-sigma28 factor (negative regulator of flagellin synthesis)
MAISGSDPVNDLNQALFGVRRAQAGDKRPGDAASPSPGHAGDTVVFSSAIKERESVVNQIHALPDIRVDYVASIQKALDAGEHHVEAVRVAAGVIRETVLNAVA